MKFIRRRAYRKVKDHSYYLRKRYWFVRRWWDALASCATIFEVDISKHHSPCVDNRFAPYHYPIGEKDWWHWLLQSNIAGKVKVDFYFTAWYSTFMHQDPADSKMERGTLRISFSNKASAMFFKLNFACPELRVIQIAHS